MANNTALSQKEALEYLWQHIIGRLNNFVSTNGGTISGNLKVNGTVEATKVVGAVYQ